MDEVTLSISNWIALLSVAITILATLAVVIGAYWKVKIDFKQLEVTTNLRMTEIENSFKEHCLKNDMDMEKMHTENRKDHLQIMDRLDKLYELNISRNNQL